MGNARQAVLRSLLWFDGPLAAIAVSVAVAIGVAWDPRSAQQAAWWLWASVLLCVLLSHLAHADFVWRSVAVLAVLTGAGVALYVALQFPYLGYEIKFVPIHWLGMAIGSPLPRLAWWAPMSNSVSTFLEGLVPLAAALAAGPGGRWWRTLAAGAAAVMCLAIVLAASRGAWVALAAGCLAWGTAWGWARRTTTAGKAVGIACLIAALLATLTAAQAVAPSIVGTRIAEIFDRPDRLSLYRNSLVLVHDFPFTGIGPGGQFAMALSRYALLIQAPFLTYAHNLYLGLWLELGLLGMTALAALLGAIMAAVLVGERAGLDGWFRGAWVGVLVVLVHGLMDARQLVDRWTWLPLFLLLGLLAARLARHRAPAAAAALALPLVTMAAFLVGASPALRPVHGTWPANKGMLAEARAELGARSSEERAQLLAEARRHFDNAVAADFTQPTARRRLGILAIDEGRFEEAYANLQISWRADPGNPAARKGLGLACAWTGRFACARELLAPVSGIFDELNVWSWHWEQQGRLTQAIYAARLALAMAPDNPESARRVAALERRVRRPE